MNKYLIEILKLRTSVTLPGFGALMIANSRTGKIVLNQLLKYDDKVLANFIAEKENIELQEAQNMVSKFIKEIDSDLAKGETYDIFQFGKLSKTENGSISFEMDKAMMKKQDSPVEPKKEVKKETIKPVVSKAVEIKETKPKVEEKPKKIVAKVKEVKVVEKAKVVVKEKIETKKKVEVKKEIPKNVFTPSAKKEVKKETVEIKEKSKISKVAKPVAGKVSAAPVVEKVKEVSVSAKEKLKQEKIANKKWQKKQLGDKEEKKKRRIWPWFLLLLLIGLAFGAYKFQDKIKEFLGINHKTEHHDDEALEEHELHADLEDEIENEGNNVIIDSTLNNETNASVNGDETEDDENETEVEVVENVVETPVQTSVTGSYHIVGGAFGEQANAEAFAVKTGGTLLGRFNGMYQVALKSYDTRAEANSALSSVRSEHSGAWVFKYAK